MEVLDETIAKGKQSVTAERVIEHNGNKVRFDIKSDSYDFQSHAYAEVWDDRGLKWNALTSIPYSKMSTPPKLYYCHDAEADYHFDKDFDELYRKTALILD